MDVEGGIGGTDGRPIFRLVITGELRVGGFADILLVDHLSRDLA